MIFCRKKEDEIKFIIAFAIICPFSIAMDVGNVTALKATSAVFVPSIQRIGLKATSAPFVPAAELKGEAKATKPSYSFVAKMALAEPPKCESVAISTPKAPQINKEVLVVQNLAEPKCVLRPSYCSIVEGLKSKNLHSSRFPLHNLGGVYF